MSAQLAVGCMGPGTCPGCWWVVLSPGVADCGASGLCVGFSLLINSTVGTGRPEAGASWLVDGAGFQH